MATPHTTRTAFVFACVFWLSACAPETSPPPAPATGVLGGAGGNDRTIVSFDGSLGGGVFDSGTAADAKPAADAVVEIKRDGGKGDASVEAGVAMDPRPCDLVLQNCPKRAACYPAGLGGSKCEDPSAYGMSSSVCTENTQCAPGFFCGMSRDARACVLLCDRRFLCGGKDSCRPISGYNDVGYCPSN